MSSDRDREGTKKKMRVTPAAARPPPDPSWAPPQVLGTRFNNDNTQTLVSTDTKSKASMIHVPRVKACEGDTVGRTAWAPAPSSLPPPVRMTAALEWTAEMEDMVSKMAHLCGREI